MKIQLKLLLFLLPVIFISCKNKESKAIEQYNELVNKSVTDTTVSYKSIAAIEEKAFKDLILSDKDLKENKDFIDGFQENEKVKTLKASIKERIIKNVQNILKDNIFVTGLTNMWTVHRLAFDGTMTKIQTVQIDLRGNYDRENIDKKYIVTLEDNGKVYINTKNNIGEDLIFEFGKNKILYYILINDRTYTSPIDKSEKIEKKIEPELEEENEESSYDSIPPSKQDGADLGGTSGDIVIAIKEKVYFYNNSDLNSKTNAYFVKGQKAEYFEISDDNLDDEFLHVNFEYRGKVKTGYILASDVKFE